MDYKDKIHKLFEYIENKKSISENNKILAINIIKYIETDVYIDILNLISTKIELVFINYEDKYITRLKKQIKINKPYLFSKKLLDITKNDILNNFEKQIGINYDICIELLKKKDYEKIYKSVKSQLSDYINILYL
jgi:hypothetical protein